MRLTVASPMPDPANSWLLCSLWNTPNIFPAYAGSKLEYTGSVTSTSEADGEGLVEITFRAANDQGDHVSGTAVIGLPLGAGK